MKKPTFTKEGKLSHIGGDYSNFTFMSYDIQELFTTRLTNHTLTEVCHYIAGYFYRENKAIYKRVYELETALKKIADFELHGDYSNAYEIQPIARAALGEKKDG